MSLALEPTQAGRAVRRQLTKLDLVVLTTFADRPNQTEGPAFYFSNVGAMYPWKGGAAKDFWPLVTSVGTLPHGFSHVPAGEDVAGREWDFELSNEIFGGQRTIQHLEGLTLEGARVEWAQLLLPDGFAPGVQDLRSLVGNEATYRYRGRIQEWGPVQNGVIRFRCQVEWPSTPWKYATDETRVASYDIGSRLPQPYGHARNVECVSADVGAVSTLAENISETHIGDIRVTDTTGFSDGVIMVGLEQMDITVVNQTTINVASMGDRGLFLVAEGPHTLGEGVAEILPVSTWYLAGGPVGEVLELNVRKPNDDQLIRVSPTLYSVDLADTAIRPGETVATFAFTSADLYVLGLSLFGADLTGSTGGPTSLEFVQNLQQVYFEGDLLSNQRCVSVGTAATPEVEGTAVNIREAVRVRFSDGSITGPAGGDFPALRFKYLSRGTLDIVNAGAAATLRMRGNGAGGFRNELQYGVNGTGTFPQNVESPWIDFTPGTMLSDLEDSGGGWIELVAFFGTAISGSSVGDRMVWSGNKVLIEYESPPDQASQAQFGAQVGFGLLFYADIDGPVAPDGSYKAGAGAVMTHPVDIMRHWIEVIGAEWAAGSIDTATYNEAFANLPGYVWGFDARTIGHAWREVLAAMGFNCRTNVIDMVEGTKRTWRMLTADDTYGWPVTGNEPELQTRERDTLLETGRILGAEIATRFQFVYAPNWSLPNSQDAYRQMLTAGPDGVDLTPSTPTASQLASLETAIGRFDLPTLAFPCVQDTDTAKDLAGYYVLQYAGRPRMWAQRGTPWWDAYGAQPGDFFTIQPPWRDTPASARVLEVVQDPLTEQRELRLIEVGPGTPIPPPPAYPQVRYDIVAGTDLRRESTWLGAVESQTGTVSFWRRPDSPVGGQTIFDFTKAAGASFLLVTDIPPIGSVDFSVRDSAGAAIFTSSTGSGFSGDVGELYHFILSWDRVAMAFHLFVNGVDVGVTPTWGSALGWAIDVADFQTVGTDEALTDDALGELGDVYVSTEYIDLSNPQNLAKFITAAGEPVDLGPNGQLPTGTSPLLFMGDGMAVPTDWDAGENRGTGGNLQTGVGPVPYAQNRVVIDAGTNLRRAGQWGVSAGVDNLSFSLWVRPSTAGGSREYVYSFGNGSNNDDLIQISRESDKTMRFRFEHNGGSVIDEVGTATLEQGVLYNILGSFITGGVNDFRLYLNDVLDMENLSTLSNAWIFADTPVNAIGCHQNGLDSECLGEYGDFWMTGGGVPSTYIDFSVVANRRLFIDAAGNPVDLGPTGLAPGQTPFAFLGGPMVAADWNAGTNLGNGGAMTLDGTVTDV